MKYLDTKKLAEAITRRVEADLAYHRVGGCAMRVMQEGRPVYEAVFGEKTPGEGDPLPIDAVYRMASMTKPVTAAAVLREISLGHLHLFDRISDFIPGYKEMEIGRLNEQGEIEVTGKAQNAMRLIHVLTHTSGVGTAELGTKELGDFGRPAGMNLKAVTEYFATVPLSFDPYTQTAYSALLGLDIAARLVEITSGMDFQSYLTKYFFEPLGMVDTCFAPTSAQRERFIGMHNRGEGKNVPGPTYPGCVFENFPDSYYSGGGGLSSTLRDYSKFAEFLLWGNEDILPTHVLRNMSRVSLPESLMPGTQQWGLGVRVIGENYGPLPADSFGWSGAYGTHFWVDPENKITAVYLKNSVYDGGSGAVTARNFEEDVASALL
ncbi:MAG: beta-lactamase family protein [Clostridia bacterium]|nr:beta-lactamase family protein [Clostridia bacterium]